MRYTQQIGREDGDESRANFCMLKYEKASKDTMQSGAGYT